MSNDEDESVVQATQTELSFFMVLVFVIMLGFMLSSAPEPQVAGSGKSQQGGKDSDNNGTKLATPERKTPQSTAHKTQTTGLKDQPKTGILAGPGSAGGREHPEKNCPGGWIGNRFVVQTDRDSKSLLFKQASAELSKDAMTCLIEFCRQVTQAFHDSREKIDHVRIEGHTSSMWKNTEKGCAIAKGGFSVAQSRAVAFECNLALSRERAKKVFDWCRDYNAKHSLTLADDEYVSHFLPEGRSSLHLIRNDKGDELDRESRRVEFVFVFKDKREEGRSTDGIAAPQR